MQYHVCMFQEKENKGHNDLIKILCLKFQSHQKKSSIVQSEKRNVKGIPLKLGVCYLHIPFYFSHTLW